MDGVSGEPDHAGPWTDATNARRCTLVDREIDGTLTPEEAVELEALQEQMLQLRKELSPVPLEDLRRMHQDLLSKAHRQQSQDGA